jgi:proline iminopeptidase
MLMRDSIERDGFKLRYHIEGEGIPVLVCGSAIYYERVFPKHLLSACQMIYYDNRVFGGACLKEASQTDFELDKIYADIEALRQKLNVEKFVIVGHSGQAYMALEYAKKYPENVSHVVMIGMAPTYDDKAHAWAENNWQAIASKERKAALERNLKKWPDDLINGLPDPQNFVQDYIRNTPKIWFDYDFDASLLWDNVGFNSQGFNYIWGKLFPQLDITQGLESFNMPVAVMVGKYDGLVAPPESWEAVRDKFKKLKVFVFDRSGHTPPLEEPAVFAEHLLGFVHNPVTI